MTEISGIPRVGDPYVWIPTAFTCFSDYSQKILGANVKLCGRVIEVSEERRWFRVEAAFPGGVIRECFKF